MKFIDRLKNFKFIDDDRDIFENSQIFAGYIEQKGIKEVEIHLSGAFEFCVAFFGSMMATAKPYLLAKPIFSGERAYVNDENFAKFLEHKNICDKELSLESKFYLKTSGSTGKSKDVEKSLQDMVVEGEYLSSKFGFSAQNIFFSSVSHQHMFGLAYRVFLPMMVGAKAFSKELNYPEAIFNLNLANHIFITSPVLLRMLVQSPRAKEIKDLAAIVSAGSELKSELRERIKELCDARIIDIYGSTETGTIAWNLGGGLMLFDAVSAGFDQREALNIRSPWCEFFQSNDWAQVQDSRLILKGRLDRVVKLNDKRISLDELDKRLCSSGILSDCYCGIHPKFSRLTALIELNEAGLAKFRQGGKSAIVKELKEILKPDFKNVLRHFKIMEKLPRNPQGKFLKSEFENALFKDSSPVWVKEQSDTWQYKFSAVMSVELEIFTHHFYKLPLLPGFFQLDFVYELAKSVGIEFKDSIIVENLKFTKFVQPNDKLSVCFEKRREKLHFEIFCNGERCSCGRIGPI
ncbi:AMP-binding protein [Campylobacter sp.]|uniref:AMP-binding protein n=1 Tax=Campylobacter sp. TaxID=205 RepID=UPI0026FDCCDD|nr:AMP-binding protein [Campylobacter sp.]